MLKCLKVAALATMISCPSVVRASSYSIGTPFSMTCVGILESRNGFIGLKESSTGNDDDDRTCDSASIAEKGTYPWSKYALREKTVSQILRTCSLGKLCRIVGYMRGLSHDNWIWVKIDSVSVIAGKAEDAQHAAAEGSKPASCLAFHDAEQVTLRGTIMQSVNNQPEGGGPPQKFRAIILDSPICFTQDLEEKLISVAVDPVSVKWLGHYVFVTGIMTASGEGWYIAVHSIKDIKQ